MTTEYAGLMAGQTVSSRVFRLDVETLAAYVEAVDDGLMPWRRGDAQFVPPMAIVAMALQGFIDNIGIPEGTVHVGQEFEIIGPVRVGQMMRSEAVVLQNSVRGEIRLIAVAFTVTDDNGMLLMNAKSTLLLSAKV